MAAKPLEDYCDDCVFFETLKQWYETGVCTASEERRVKTIDDVCDCGLHRWNES